MSVHVKASLVYYIPGNVAIVIEPLKLTSEFF